MPIYYISKVMADAETRYSKMEQTTLSLKNVTQKLRPYFQAHPIVMLTNQPLRSILHKPDLSRKMLKWAIELSEYEIEYQPRLSIKRQVMADFILEVPQQPPRLIEPGKGRWSTLHVDGASWTSGF